MEGLYEMVWVVLLVIGITAVIKVITLVRKERSSGSNQANGNQTALSAGVNQPNRISASETGPMVYYANDRHGRRDKEYQFNYKKIGGSWRAYILRMPSLGSRDSSGAVTHRLYDNGQPYVCWDSTVTSLKDMQTISRVWADSIQEYIATGKRFG